MSPRDALPERTFKMSIFSRVSDFIFRAKLLVVPTRCGAIRQSLLHHYQFRGNFVITQVKYTRRTRDDLLDLFNYLSIIKQCAPSFMNLQQIRYDGIDSGVSNWWSGVQNESKRTTSNTARIQCSGFLPFESGKKNACSDQSPRMAMKCTDEPSTLSRLGRSHICQLPSLSDVHHKTSLPS